MPRFVVTGASGFVGRRLVSALDGAAALAMGRPGWESGAGALTEAQCVFHLAGRAHDPHADEEQYQRDNVDKARSLARLCVERRARRIVFLSTIKVNGEETRDRAISADDVPAPEDGYARSKLRAEEALREECARGAVELVVVRSPLVYGRDARGNLRALVRLADSPWPLPFGAIANARSFVHVDDLCEALLACARYPPAAGRIYLVAHRDTPSTPQLLARVRTRLGRPERLFDVPPGTLERLAAAMGAGARIRRLTRSLVLDPARAERELGWRARRGLDEAVRDLVEGHRGGAP